MHESFCSAYHFKLRRRLIISGVGVLWFRPGVVDEILWNGICWIPPPPVLNCEMDEAGVPKEPGDWLFGDGDTRTWEKFWDKPEEFENNWCCGWLAIPDGNGEIEGATKPTLWNGGVRFTLNGSSTGVGGIDRCSWCTVGCICALGLWLLRLPNKFKLSFEESRFKWLREAWWLSFIECVLDKNEELLTRCVNSVTFLQNKQQNIYQMILVTFTFHYKIHCFREIRKYSYDLSWSVCCFKDSLLIRKWLFSNFRVLFSFLNVFKPSTYLN